MADRRERRRLLDSIQVDSKRARAETYGESADVSKLYTYYEKNKTNYSHRRDSKL
jgi:hypothetical protein